MSLAPNFPVKPESFPDAATCLIRHGGAGDMPVCLSRWGWDCSHMVFFDRTRFCRHADALTGLIPQAPGSSAT